MSKLENSIYKNITKEANIIYKKTKNNLKAIDLINLAIDNCCIDTSTSLKLIFKLVQLRNRYLYKEAIQLRNIAGKSIKEKINKLNRDKFSIKEIAMIIGENDCVANYDKCPELCNEYADCYECWKDYCDKCIEKQFIIKRRKKIPSFLYEISLLKRYILT